MTQHINLFQNNMINAAGHNAPKPIIDAIYSASKKSGVDFSYLVNQAKAESSFNPNAKAGTSSATGLYQFIDSTWMQMVERYGEDYGIDTKGMSKKEILALRQDPEASSFMAAAFASENERVLNRHWGGDVGATELYFAHFLGASGASAFLNARDENPMTPAADLFPRAARANRNVFYDSNTGNARSLEEVYAFFDKKFNGVEKSSNTLMAEAPIPPKMPSRKIASAYFDRTAINKDSVIMQRAQAMRDQANSSGFDQYGRIDYTSNIPGRQQIRNNAIANAGLAAKQNTNAPSFASLIARPLDVMIMTQSVPGQVVRDNA